MGSPDLRNRLPAGPDRPSRRPRPHSAIRRPHWAAALGLLACLVPAALRADEPPAPAPAAPYLDHRAATLGYHGPSEDLAGLTEFRLGWFAPADPADPLNGDLWWAAGLAVAEANAEAPAAAGALPFRLVPRWTSDPWGSGVSQLTRMVYDEQPLALLGSIDSASTHLAEQVVAKANLPLVSPIATDPSVTLAGVSWVFSCAPDDQAVARCLVDALCAGSAPGSRPPAVALLAATDHESRMTARALVRELERRGCPPAFRFDVPAGSARPDLQLSALRAAQPPAVVVIAGAEDAARLTRLLRASLGAVPVYGPPSLGRRRFLELAGPAAEGVRFPLLFSADSAAAAAFAARCTAERGHAPDYATVLTYDATRLLLAAIRRAGPNRARIREALIALSPWPGLAGPIAFDGTGQNRRTGLPLGTIRAGAVVPAPVSPTTPSRPTSP